MKKKRILLSCGRSFHALDLARKFASAGHEVYVAESWPIHFCLFSRLVARCFRIPSPRIDVKGFNDALIDIINAHQIDVYIPVFQETIYVSSALQRYPASCQVICPPFERIYELENKWLFNQKVAAFGLSAPESFLINSPADFSQLDKDEFYALKPCITIGAQQLHKIRGDQPPKHLEFRNYNPWIAQRWLNGKKYCTYGICVEGKLLAHGIYPVSFSINESSCLTFEAIEHEQITHWVSHFAAREHFSGQFGFDFIETADGTLYPIECNPRGTSGLHLFDAEECLERAFFGEQKEMIVPKTGRTKQLAVGMSMYGWRGREGFGKFLRKFLTTSDVVFQFNDPLPFFCIPLYFIAHLHLSYKLGLSMPNAFLHDIQWDGNFSLLGGENDLAKPISVAEAS